VSTGIGDTLREAREAQGRSLEDAAQAVRARAAQLQAIEDDQFDRFGGDVYAKGFIKSYALELGLDPAPLIEEFNREVGHPDESVTSSMVKPVKTPGPKGTTPPAWAAWVLVAAVVVGGLYFLGLITPGATPDQAAEEIDTPPVPSAPGNEEAEEPGDEPEDVTEEPGNADEEADPDDEGGEEADEPEIEGVEVIFALERRSWMRVTVDGAVLLEETVAEGQTLRYEGDEVIVRIGDAAGVRIQHNGEDLGPAGGSGEVVDLRFTEDGVEDV
jgi:cytoskeleton protein RodZ